jgi:nucleoside-diphosphate-sugar epimerase
MKILVLGSEGQIGKSVCNFLKEKQIDIIEWDIEKDPSHDLRINKNGLLNVLNECDFVYYFASDVGGAKYLEKNQNNFNFIKNNIDIMSLTFSCLKESNKPFIFTSSQMAELSHSTYGLLKMIGEKMCQDIGGLVVRLWNVYGHEKNEEKAHVITDFIKMAKFENVIKMRTDGEESRQFLFAEDCAECLFNLTNEYNLKSGEIGIIKSNLDIIKDAKKNNYKTILVIEDDCVFYDEIVNFEDYFNQLPNDWDMLYMGGNHNTHMGVNPPQQINEKIVKL